MKTSIIKQLTTCITAGALVFNSLASVASQSVLNSALSRSQVEGYAPSQLGSDPFALGLASGNTSLAFGVRPQLFGASQTALTGNRFLGNYQSDEEEYMALMNSAITSARQFNLRPGIGLTAEQVAQLTSDIVWLVETEVVLPDGTKTKALVVRFTACKA